MTGAGCAPPRLASSFTTTSSTLMFPIHWLKHTYLVAPAPFSRQVYSIQLKTLETEITKYRKQRRSFNSKLRTLRKNGQELSEVDSVEFDRVCSEQAAIQKQIEAVRKASRQHNMVLQVRDWRVGKMG